jgi:two-component system response regulator BaeR
VNKSTDILVIEDEPKIAQILVEFLQQENFNVEVIDDGLEAVEAVKSVQPRFVILDLMLPNKDGLTICKEVRQFSDVPILMLTARVDEIDRLMGLGFGADDYVCKPFSAREVVARVHTILRRSEVKSTKTTEEILSYQEITLNIERFQCTVNQLEVELTPVEFRILRCLISKPGFVQSRDKLMGSIYQDERIVSARTIDSHVKNLRSKLITALGGKNILHSIYGVGYKIE